MHAIIESSAMQNPHNRSVAELQIINAFIINPLFSADMKDKTLASTLNFHWINHNFFLHASQL